MLRFLFLLALIGCYSTFTDSNYQQDEHQRKINKDSLGFHDKISGISLIFKIHDDGMFLIVGF